MLVVVTINNFSRSHHVRSIASWQNEVRMKTLQLYLYTPLTSFRIIQLSTHVALEHSLVSTIALSFPGKKLSFEELHNHSIILEPFYSKNMTAVSFGYSLTNFCHLATKSCASDYNLFTVYVFMLISWNSAPLKWTTCVIMPNIFRM